MFGMNVNGVVKGNELRLVAQEVFNKAKTQAKAPEAEVSNLNPFLGSRSEFIPQETKTAKTGFEQNKVEINPEMKKTVNSQAAIERYGNLSFRSQSQIASDDVQPELMPEIFNMGAASGDNGEKNPLMMLLAALLQDRKERTGDDPVQSIFAMAAMAGKK